MALAAVRSRAVVLLVLIVAPIVGFCGCSLQISTLKCPRGKFLSSDILHSNPFVLY